MSRLPLPALCAALCAASLGFAQSGTLDQVSPFTNAGFSGGSSSNWQCNVRAGMDGTLEGFNMTLLGTIGQNIDFAVRRGGGWNNSAILFQGTTTLISTGNYDLYFIDVSSANISLVAGELFVIEVLNGASGINLQGSYDAVNPLYPEDLFLNGGPGCFADCGWHIGFETYMFPGPSTPILGVSNLTAGGLATFSVSNATPSGTVQIGLSLAGAGPINTPFGVADLTPPVTLMASMVADASGSASLSITVPTGTSGLTVWFQALDFGSSTFSNGLQEIVL